MVINIDSKDFCDLMNFVAHIDVFTDVKFEVDPVMNDCIDITISVFDRRDFHHSRKTIPIRDLVSGTFGITETIKRTMNDMKRDIMNYVEKENKHDKN